MSQSIHTSLHTPPGGTHQASLHDFDTSNIPQWILELSLEQLMNHSDNRFSTKEDRAVRFALNDMSTAIFYEHNWQAPVMVYNFPDQIRAMIKATIYRYHGFIGEDRGAIISSPGHRWQPSPL